MRLIATLKSLADYTIGLLYPNVCNVCGQTLVRGEEVMCLDCLSRLPRVRITDFEHNGIHEKLASTIPIERAASWFYYQRDSEFRQLIINAKYHQRPDVARRLARRLANELKKRNFFDGIDAVMAVPMNRWKRMRRGYNQSDYIALGVSEVTGLPIMSDLITARMHYTQTRLNAVKRWQNAQSVFQLKYLPDPASMHILIVDDVITTGATILSCSKALHDGSPSTKISVMSLALSQLS